MSVLRSALRSLLCPQFSCVDESPQQPVQLKCGRVLCRTCWDRRHRRQPDPADPVSCFSQPVTPHLLMGLISELGFHRAQFSKQTRKLTGIWVPPRPQELASLHCGVCEELYEADVGASSKNKQACLLTCGHDMCKGCYVKQRVSERRGILPFLRGASKFYGVWCRSCRAEVPGNPSDPGFSLANVVITEIDELRKLLRTSTSKLCPVEAETPLQPETLDLHSKFCGARCAGTATPQTRPESATRLRRIGRNGAKTFINKKAATLRRRTASVAKKLL
ncbi:unnamed protein product, partial [Mesorhabditis spiculigera]